MKLRYILVAALVLAFATNVSASAAPAPPPAAAAAQAQPSQLDQVVAAYRQLQTQFQDFQQSVYTPYCAVHKGLSAVALLGSADKGGVRPAWPAVVSCKDGYITIVKSPLQKPI